MTQALLGGHMPTQMDRGLAVHRADRRGAGSSYDGLLIFRFIAASAWLMAPTGHRFASRAVASLAGLGLRVPWILFP